MKQRSTTSQVAFDLARVASLGGLAIVARGKADVRAALVARFGEDAVKGWER